MLVTQENPLPPLADFTVKALAHLYSVAVVYGMYEVKVSPLTRFGMYQHSLRPALAGRLWFDGNELVDYDGLVHLPRDVCLALNRNGFVVSAALAYFKP